MNIKGKDCTLAVAKENDLFIIPYCEETLRQTSKGYSLPCVLNSRAKEKYVEVKKEITGCFVSFVSNENIAYLFSLISKVDECFDIYTDRIFGKSVYKNLKVKGFELRAFNGEPFKLKIDVKENSDSYVTAWPWNMPDLTYFSQQFYCFNGNKVFVNGMVVPLVYRFELSATCDEQFRYLLTLYFPLSTEFYPETKEIDELKIVINDTNFYILKLNSLKPVDDLCEINCADTVLCFQKFKVLGDIVFTIRNKRQFLEIKL